MRIKKEVVELKLRIIEVRVKVIVDVALLIQQREIKATIRLRQLINYHTKKKISKKRKARIKAERNLLIKEGKIKIKIKNIIAKTIIKKEITIMIIGKIVTNITKVVIIIMIEEINREMLEEIITRMREEAIMMRDIQKIINIIKDLQGIIEMIRDIAIIRMSGEMRIIKTEDIRMII